MGSWNGAEVCEIVGLYILSQLKHLDMTIGLYRDDGLGVIRHVGGPEIECRNKAIIQIFKQQKPAPDIERLHPAELVGTFSRYK